MLRVVADSCFGVHLEGDVDNVGMVALHSTWEVEVGHTLYPAGSVHKRKVAAGSALGAFGDLRERADSKATASIRSEVVVY